MRRARPPKETEREVMAGDMIGQRIHPETGVGMVYVAAQPVHGTTVCAVHGDGLAEVRVLAWSRRRSYFPPRSAQCVATWPRCSAWRQGQQIRTRKRMKGSVAV